MTAAARWEVPEEVERPSAEGLARAYRRVCEVTGMRTAGWLTLTVSVSCLALGVAFGWAEFVVVGVLAFVTVLLALLFTIGRADLSVSVDLTRRSVVVGEPAAGTLEVRNASGRRHWGSRLDLPVGDTVASFQLRSIRPGEGITERFRIPTARRGLVLVGPANSVLGDPFGLAGRERRWTEELELYVHPRTVPLPGRQTGFVHDLEGHASVHLSSSDMNFHALRPYVAGDDRRHVHWRSTARAGRLMVRQYEESRMSRIVVALDTGRSSYLDADEFELAVSCAGSLALQSIYAESPLALLTTRDELTAVTPGRALDSLSLVEQTTRGGVGDLVGSTVLREPGASIAVVVTGSSSTLMAVREACARFDIDMRVVGIRVAAGAPLRARTVANTTLLQVGSLEELPRAMREAAS